MKKLLMLGTSYMSVEIVEYAKSIGVYTIVTDPREPSKSIAKLVADEYWMINVSEIDLLEQKCREENITAIMCGVSEYCLEVSMELCKRLGLPNYCTPEAWHYSRDKADFKKLCHEVNAPVADDYYFSDAVTKEELAKVKYPVVVKPVDMSGNRGISYCYNEEELVEAINYAKSLSKSPKIVVERMLKGKEWYSYYAIANGEIRQICLNAMEAEPGQLKNLYSLTTSISDNVERYMQEIEPKIKEVLRKVGCREGIAWVQAMLDEDDHFYIIEMGYRLPGDLPDKAYPFLCNFNALKWLTDYALGKKYTSVDLPAEQEHMYKRCTCGYSLWTHAEGIVGEFIGFDELNQKEGLHFYTIHQSGEKFALHRPLGVISVEANDVEDFIEKIKYINEKISITDDKGNDVIIRYTDFDHLREVYYHSLEVASK